MRLILRRLSEAIVKQNWTTVTVEVLVVIVGIFIGLQVDDWNQARKDGNDEQPPMRPEFTDRYIPAPPSTRRRRLFAVRLLSPA